jgi:dipeptidyl aminopeptidase/acylaminoacyl peptidase
VPSQPRPFRPADLARERQVTSFSLSADGERCVFAVRSIQKGKYRSSLWRVATGGGRAEVLTTAAANDTAPRIAPDGSAVLFVSDRGEGPASAAWVMPLDGGEPRRLAPVAGGVAAAEWSPDGRRVLLLGPTGERRFSVGDPDDPTALAIDSLVWRVDGVGLRDQRNAVWIAAADGTGAARRVTPVGVDVAQPRWIDDERIGFLADLRPDFGEERYRVYTVGVEGGRHRETGTLAGAVWGAAWSVDGRLATIGVDEPDNALWRQPSLFVHEGRRGAPRMLGAELDRPATQTSYGDMVTEGMPIPRWEDDSHLLTLVADRGRAHPTRFGLDGSVERLTDGDVVAADVQAGGGRLVMLANVGPEPADLFELRPGRDPRRFTKQGARWFGPFRREVETVGERRRAGDGIDAWMLRGRRGRRPTVLQIHGGPYASHAPVPWLEMMALTSAGFHVIWANPAGSLSYGQRFAQDLDGRWGGPDTRQWLKLVDRLAAEGIVDRDRVGLLGLSYGGFETLWFAGHHPDRVRAAVAENPVSDMVSEYGAGDYGAAITTALTGLGPLPEAAAAYREASPATTITRFAGPLLLLQSEQDHRCPPINSELVFALRKANGVPVEMVRYPDESHWLAGIGRPDRRCDRLERIVEHFRRHL